MVQLYNAIILALFALMLIPVKPQSKSGNRLALLAGAIGLSVVSGVRMQRNGDFANYFVEMQRASQMSLSEALSMPDPGGQILRWALARVTDNPQWFFVVTSIFIVFSIVWFCAQFSPDPRFSLFLFVGLGGYFTAHVIVLQYFALAVSLFGFRSLIQRRFLQYFGIILVASTFHASALILLILYPLAATAFKRLLLLSYGAVLALVVAFFNPILGFIQRFAYQGYDESAYGMKPADARGTFLVLWVALIIVIASVQRERSDDRVSPIARYSSRELFYLENVLHHMAAISVMFSVLAVSKSLILSRLGEYMTIGFLVSVPYFLRRVSRRDKMILYYLALTATLASFLVLNGLGKLTPTPYLGFWQS